MGTFRLRDFALTSRSADITAKSIRWNSSSVLHGVGRSIIILFIKMQIYKDLLLEFHLIDFAFMSAEHDVSAKSLSRKVPTKRHTVAYKLSRWDASDSHLISLTLLHVHSSRRAPSDRGALHLRHALLT